MIKIGDQDLEEAGDSASNGQYFQIHRELQELQRRYVELNSRLTWMTSVAAVLSEQPRTWVHRIIPQFLWRNAQMKVLRRKELFDETTYLYHNPDVESVGIDPLVHYLRHGLAEQRGGVSQLNGNVQAAVTQDIIDSIISSGFFDHEWYQKTYSDTSSDVRTAITHYLERSQNDTLHNPGPLFSGGFYLSENPDTHGVQPLLHYLTFGLQEGRRAISPARADAFMVGASSEAAPLPEKLIDAGKTNIILHWDNGNFFFADIANYLADYLTNRGYKCKVCSDDDDFVGEEYNYIVIAPHEYCVHGPGRLWSEAKLASAIYVNTEQWHTSWFSLALDKMLVSKKAFDINPASARGLCRLGIETAFLPLYPSESTVFRFDDSDLSESTKGRRFIKPLHLAEDFYHRPYDILFVGAANERREAALANLAPVISQFDCFIHCPRSQGPLKDNSFNMISSKDVAQIARNTKILINIHQGKSHYFEWHRLFVSGICEGCIVVTEPCVGTGIINTGEHYLECTINEMPKLISWLLTTDEGKMAGEKIRENCKSFLANIRAAGHS